jgi:hypothetical protein
VAERIEHLAQHAQRRLITVLRSSLRVKKFEFARTCYDHRAGTLGLRDGMLRAGLVDGEAGLALTGVAGKSWGNSAWTCRWTRGDRYCATVLIGRSGGSIPQGPSRRECFPVPPKLDGLLAMSTASCG